MKGLLLKDFYMSVKYCRTYFIFALAFTLFSVMSDGNIFFLFYPCLMAGMIPITLYSYDEKEKWNEYSMTLPFSSSDTVSSKYILGLIITVISVSVIMLAFGISMAVKGNFSAESFFTVAAVSLSVSLILPSLMMPFTFKFGVEKGRMIYYGAAVLAGTVLGAVEKETGNNTVIVDLRIVLAGSVLAAAVIFAVSWVLSINLYRSRQA